MSVTAARGFRAAGVAAGLKASGKPDVALVVNDGPSDVAAAVFTTNRVRAAPVLWSQQVIKDRRLRVVVLNSGGANACTGPDGFIDAHHTAEHVADTLSSGPSGLSGLSGTRRATASSGVTAIGAGDVAVCSTGLIGERLPMRELRAGIEAAAAALARDGGAAAAEAICTTDTVSKQAHRTHASGWTIGGMAKGAGMLAPGLATMLVVITTDVILDPSDADRALRAATRVTFDRLDSDGCMSTNDTVLLLASGSSGLSPAVADFTAELTAVCDDLAAQLLADAEGATKEIAIEVVNAASEDDAVEVGRSVARSNLLKAALFGNDPNWGRVLAAVGTTRAAFEADELDVSMNGVQICRSCAPGQDRNGVDLTPRAVHILIDLHAGDACATIRTNDLSHAYVEENSAYST